MNRALTYKTWGAALFAISLASACGLPGQKTLQSSATSSQLANADADPASPETSVSEPKPPCIPRASAQPDASQARPGELKLSEYYGKNCVKCHGGKGEGRVGPDIRAISYQSFTYSARNGRAGVMPAFDESQYPNASLDNDYRALTGKEIPTDSGERCPIDKSGDNPDISPAIAYDQEEKGPQARGLGFALDPFVLPYVICKNLPSKTEPGKTTRVCANAGISGSTEEGYHFADFGVCKDVRTQRPYTPRSVFNRSGKGTRDERLQDPQFASELAWVTEQIRSSGCVCCHDSSINKWTAFWDISKDKIWTDQLDKYAIEVFTGRVDSTALGAYPPGKNFGFDRLHTGLPTTDVPRMEAFFKALSKDLGTSDEEIKSMPPLADFLASQLREPVKACGKNVGVDSKTMKIKWNLAPVRYIYILKKDAQTPLVTPNLDKPKGTLWRIDVPSNSFRYFLTNTIRYGEVPYHAKQTIPDPERFEKVEKLVKGETYHLVAQLDMAFPVTNCMFTF